MLQSSIGIVRAFRLIRWYRSDAVSTHSRNTTFPTQKQLWICDFVTTSSENRRAVTYLGSTSSHVLTAKRLYAKDGYAQESNRHARRKSTFDLDRLQHGFDRRRVSVLDNIRSSYQRTTMTDFFGKKKPNDLPDVDVVWAGVFGTAYRGAKAASAASVFASRVLCLDSAVSFLKSDPGCYQNGNGYVISIDGLECCGWCEGI
ncbi:uncharacterized protein RCC_11084 [Ramularia collo-cygni]|uniref:Uncharacterized protein n=1 Tax=Ramularia collo-cygni TaxID=112498 RepID=A0A2D3VH41_9PEZI|nr:uncharacterized protein RCC_11084 [Ramularia collo-cygni]CZT25355.1 uncharacterized protein RCC_11084 [Ramularia collo-cygni]